MGHRIILAALALPGCILEPRFCGEGFVESDGRCVPASAAPAWYSDGGPPPDVGVLPDDARLPPDARVLDAEPAVPDVAVPDRWADRRTVLIVDRGSQQAARAAPATPGFDLDAVSVFGPDGQVVGDLGAVIEARIHDPFSRSLATRADAAIGAADAEGIDDVDAFVSLGTEGAYIFAGWQLARPLRTGDTILVFEMGDDRESEAAEIYLCLDHRLSLDRCVSIGTIEGTQELVLQP
ncbi:MAG: hypothetical protein H6706_25320 [Myxococcales bacterium]|nr:hypothetical protein [Myxococcales bacterium]